MPPVNGSLPLDDGDRYLRLADLVKYSTLSLRTINRYLADPVRPIPSHKIGGRVLVLKSEFDRWLRERDAPPTDEAKNAALQARVVKALEASRRG